LKNRFFQVPHCVGFGSDKPGSQAYFRAMKAEGGWAAVCTEYCSIHPESDDSHRISARLWDDEDVKNLSLVSEMIHQQGSLAGVELYYGGAHAPCMDSRLVPRGPSQIPSEAHMLGCCKEMDKDDIREVQGFWVAAARRARDAGFDIIDVYGAHNMGPLQFLSPWSNKRTDEYGGSFENRARYWRETLEQIREAVGRDCAIATRFSIDTLYPPGKGIEVDKDGLAFVKHVDHLVDLWDINIGDAAEYGEDAGSCRFHPENHEKPWVEKVKKVSKKPVVGVGRLTNPDTMVEIIKNGQLDIIGAARPSISDPFLPKKIEEGRLDDIRECIGCNVCSSRFEMGGNAIICTQNATTGEEYRRGWHPERFTKAKNADSDVLVVGAGPAGMECAVVLGKRGLRRVHLVEAETEMGGSARLASWLPGLGEWARVINYRKIQLDKLKNVEVHTRERLGDRDVLEYGADIVILATGSHWAKDGLNPATAEQIPGGNADLDHVLTPEQVMAGKKVGDRVLVLDNEGYYMGVGIAEKLARDGKKVTLLTHLGEIAPYTVFTTESPNIHRMMHKLGIDYHVHMMLKCIENGKAISYHVYDPTATSVWLVDSVVLVTQRRSDDSIYRQLKNEKQALENAGIKALYRIGDCVAPRIMAEVVFDGHRLAREIDTSNPEAALPYIRERQVGLKQRVAVFEKTSVLA
jgi:dimethylamine/trimethylamine dehydrogenase